jgi:hypothetical protein
MLSATSTSHTASSTLVTAQRFISAIVDCVWTPMPVAFLFLVYPWVSNRRGEANPQMSLRDRKSFTIKALSNIGL